MCKWGTSEAVWVKIPTDLSSTGKVKWKSEDIDACIAPIVRALQTCGIDMRGSCCGHGKWWGEIRLQDGRTLLVADKQYQDMRLRYLLWMFWKQAICSLSYPIQWVYQRAKGV